MFRQTLLIIVSVILVPGFSLASSQHVPQPGSGDKCPVCGMFVAPYADWLATVLYRDGTVHHFDGPKDMFKYLLDMEKWAPGRTVEQIRSITVAEYYGLGKIDAREAYFVIGSDVLGPMGHELVPLSSPKDAELFKQDHQGREIRRFDEISTELLSVIDRGQFE